MYAVIEVSDVKRRRPPPPMLTTPVAVVHMCTGLPGGPNTLRIDEYRKLVRAYKSVWKTRERTRGNAVAGGEDRERWRASTEFRELQEGHYKAVGGHDGFHDLRRPSSQQLPANVGGLRVLGGRVSPERSHT